MQGNKKSPKGNKKKRGGSGEQKRDKRQDKGRRGHAKKTQTYRRKLGRAEARSAIKPVIVAQLVDLDALLVLMRHRLCHHQGLGIVPRDELATVAHQIGREVEMLLQRQLRRLGMVEDGKRRHGAVR